jgi:thiamine kinase-like enzyme
MISDLIGHSGCEIYLKNDSVLVKKSANIDYNKRLSVQISKQSSFESNLIDTPKILSTYIFQDLFVTEMEYINSLKLSNYIHSKPINNILHIFSILNSYVEKNLKNSSTYVDLKKIQIKLDQLNQNHIINSTNICDKIKVQLHNMKIPQGYCHGDLTFENILIKDEKIYFIDFLDSFIQSPLIDYAKLYQDIYFKWSFRNSKRNTLRNIKLNHINKINLNGDWIKEYQKEIDILYAINLLRIVPYSTSKQMNLEILIETHKIIDKWK